MKPIYENELKEKFKLKGIDIDNSDVRMGFEVAGSIQGDIITKDERYIAFSIWINEKKKELEILEWDECIELKLNNVLEFDRSILTRLDAVREKNGTNVEPSFMHHEILSLMKPIDILKLLDNRYEYAAIIPSVDFRLELWWESVYKLPKTKYIHKNQFVDHVLVKSISSLKNDFNKCSYNKGVFFIQGCNDLSDAEVINLFHPYQRYLMMKDIGAYLKYLLIQAESYVCVPFLMTNVINIL